MMVKSLRILSVKPERHESFIESHYLIHTGRNLKNLQKKNGLNSYEITHETENEDIYTRKINQNKWTNKLSAVLKQQKTQISSRVIIKKGWMGEKMTKLSRL